MLQDTASKQAQETAEKVVDGTKELAEKVSKSDAVSGLWDKLDGWVDSIILKLPNIAVAILVLIVFYFLAKVLSKVIKRLVLRRVKEQSIKEIIGQIVFAVVLAIGFFVALGVMDLDKVLTSVLAGAGVVGLAIGLALQGTLSNTVSGFILSFLPQISLGDWIESNDNKGFVTEINLRNVTIKRPDNNYTIIPNANFVDNAFTNYSLSKRSRIIIGCGVGYESDLEMVENLVVKIIGEKFKQEKNEEVEFFYKEFGDSSINFIVRFWANEQNGKDALSLKHEAIKTIKKHFDENEINIPFPIRTLDFGKNKLQMAATENSNKE